MESKCGIHLKTPDVRLEHLRSQRLQQVRSPLSTFPLPFLTFLQVERGYFMHRSGDYSSNTNEFSSTNWLRATTMYADKIQNDLDDDNWKAIFDALNRLQESCNQEAQVEAGIVLEDREALLPADPPTPPRA
jgi:hypothetical protein